MLFFLYFHQSCRNQLEKHGHNKCPTCKKFLNEDDFKNQVELEKRRKLKPKNNEWKCGNYMCLWINKNNTTRCIKCGMYNVNDSGNYDFDLNNTSSPSLEEMNERRIHEIRSETPQETHKWSCSVCTFLNDQSSHFCEICLNHRNTEK